jgi:hypothetical protein
VTLPIHMSEHEYDGLVARYRKAEARVHELEALLHELIDIEGPQPGHINWYRKVQGALHNVAEDRCKVCKNDHYPACDAGPCINCDWPALECVHNGRCCRNCHHSQSDRGAE